MDKYSRVPLWRGPIWYNVAYNTALTEVKYKSEFESTTQKTLHVLRKLPRATTNVQKNKSYVGLFISYVGLFISYVGLFISYVGLIKSYVGL